MANTDNIRIVEKSIGNRGQGRDFFSLYSCRVTTGETYHGDFHSMEEAASYAHRLVYGWASLSHDEIIEVVLASNGASNGPDHIWRWRFDSHDTKNMRWTALGGYPSF